MNAQQHQPTILITDDDAQNRLLLKHMLLDVLPDATITEASNGALAIDIVSEKIRQDGKGFDLVFMDFKMPGLNGEQTTNSIRELESQTRKCIIITWSSMKSQPYSNANDWMPKPPEKKELIYILSTYGFMGNFK